MDATREPTTRNDIEYFRLVKTALPIQIDDMVVTTCDSDTSTASELIETGIIQFVLRLALHTNMSSGSSIHMIEASLDTASSPCEAPSLFERRPASYSNACIDVHKLIRQDIETETREVDERNLRRSVGLLLTRRESLRQKIVSRQTVSIPWRKRSIGTTVLNRATKALKLNPAPSLLLDWIWDDHSYADQKQLSNSREEVATREEGLSHPTALLYTRPNFELHLDRLFSSDPDKHHEHGGVNVTGATISRMPIAIKIPETQDQKKRLILQTDERRGVRDNRKIDKSSRTSHDRITKERGREVERMGRLLRRAAELDVTRCCNDVRTLLQARWQCQEAHMLIGDPPPVSGNEVHVAHDMVMTLGLQRERHPSIQTMHHSDRALLELGDLLYALIPTVSCELRCPPTSAELRHALDSIDKESSLFSPRANDLLERVAMSMVQLMVPGLYRLLSLDRFSVESCDLIPVNALTWPCLARMMLIVCANREIGVPEATILGEIRGSCLWTTAPLHDSPDWDTQALLCARSSRRPSSVRRLSTKLTSCLHDAECSMPACTFRVATPCGCRFSASPGNIKSARRVDCCYDAAGFKVPCAHASSSNEGTSIQLLSIRRFELDPDVNASSPRVDCAGTSFTSGASNKLHVGTQDRFQMWSELRSVHARFSPSPLSTARFTIDQLLSNHLGCRIMLEGDKSLPEYTCLIRSIIRDNITCRHDVSDRSSEAARLLASFEGSLKRQQVIGDVLTCIACEKVVRDDASMCRCRRCNNAYHLSCLILAGELRSGDEKPALPWFCPYCTDNEFGPDPTDGWVGNMLGKSIGANFEAIGTIESVEIATTEANSSDTYSYVCNVRTSTGEMVQQTVSRASFTEHYSFANAGWGIPASYIPMELSSHAAKVQDDVTFSQLIEAISLLSSHHPRTRAQWVTVLTALVVSVAYSEELQMLLLHLCEIRTDTEDSADSAVVRFRPRIRVSRNPSTVAITHRSHTLPQCTIQEVSSSSRSLKPSTPDRKSSEASTEDRILCHDFQFRQDIIARHSPLHLRSLNAIDDESGNATMCISTSSHDQRKLKEGRLLAEVIQASVKYARLEDIDDLQIDEHAHFRSHLVQAARKGVTGEAYIYAGGDYLTSTEVVPDSGRRKFSCIPCYLCGGDYDYLSSDMQLVETESTRDQPQAVAHEFCAESALALQSASCKGKVRPKHDTIQQASRLPGRTQPLGADARGVSYWRFFSDGNTLYLEVTSISVGITWVKCQSASKIASRIDNVSAMQCTRENTLLITTLCRAYPAAAALSATFRRGQPHVCVGEAAMLATVDASIRSHTCDTHCFNEQFGERLKPCYGSPRRVASESVLLRGLGILWRAEVMSVRDCENDAMYAYRVRFVKWGRPCNGWIQREQLLTVSQTALLGQTSLYYQNSLVRAHWCLGWIMGADLAATAYLNSGTRYVLALNTYIRSFIHNTRAWHGDLRRVKAALIAVEAALPVGSKTNWCRARAVSRITSIFYAVEAVQLVEYMLLLEDELQPAWVHARWVHARQSLPARTFLLRHCALSWVALLLWLLDKALMYDKHSHDNLE